MISKKKVLITSGFWQGAISCIQSLGRKGYEVYLIENSQEASAGYSKYCTKQLFSPLEREIENYWNFFSKLIQHNEYELFIPISDQVVDIVAPRQNEISKYVQFLLSDKEQIKLVRNKKAWYQFALKNNIRIPLTYFPQNMGDVERLSKTITFPCFIKLSFSTSSVGVFPAKDQDFLINYYCRLSAQDDWPVIQQNIDGDIYGVTAVCDHGKIKLHFSFFADYIYSHGGTPPIAYSVNDNQLLAEASQVVELLNWTGAIDFDYIRDKAGKYYLLEINPRFSGTVNFAYRLGIDMPLAYAQLALGEELTVRQIPYRSDIAYRTILPEEIVFWYTQKECRNKVLLNWLKFGSKTNIFWDDWSLIKAQLKETRLQCLRRNNQVFR